MAREEPACVNHLVMGGTQLATVGYVFWLGLHSSVLREASLFLTKKNGASSDAFPHLCLCGVAPPSHIRQNVAHLLH